MKYTKDHEWIKMNSESTALVGISDHAQESLGDITFVEMPSVGEEFKAGEVFGVVESVKAASDIYMPIDCKVIEINEGLVDSPELLNKDPLVSGWIVKVEVKRASDLDGLMTEEEYLASL